MRRALLRARSIEDVRALARSRLPAGVFDFFDGGAEDEVTLRANRAAFERRMLLPHVLTGVAQIDTRTDIAGSAAGLPMVIAPMGATGFGWPGSDIAIARAAARAGIPYTLSSTATTSLERLAAAAPGRLWFQPYMFRDRPFLARLIDRAEAAGYEALVMTLDMPAGGKRERDFRHDFSVPFRYTTRNLREFASCPRWGLAHLRHGLPVLENLIGLDRMGESIARASSSVGLSYDPDFGWHDLEAIRARWTRRLLVKGVLRADDAQRLAAMGCDGVVVSNHGGRQLDGASAALDALPAIVAGVGHRMDVLVDGGVRRGSDIVKAIALGARGVMVGRAALFGAAAGGEDGAWRAVEILVEELTRTMRLCGTRSIAQIDATLLAPAV